jgi:hypothetical protein
MTNTRSSIGSYAKVSFEDSKVSWSEAEASHAMNDLVERYD